MSSNIPPKTGRKRPAPKKPVKSGASRLGAASLIAWIVCGVFVVLLMGVAIRQVIVVTRRVNEVEKPTEHVEPIDPNPQQIAALPKPRPEIGPDPVVEAVSPPAVLKRTLPTTLIVGDGEGEYESLLAALSDVISGDTIELRTDSPQEISVPLIGSTDKTFQLSIVAGAGFSPVLRQAAGRTIFDCDWAELRLSNLVIYARFAGATPIRLGRADLHCDSCFIISETPNRFDMGRLVSSGEEAFDATIELENCFFRNAGVLMHYAKVAGEIDRCDVRMRNCLQVGSISFMIRFCDDSSTSVALDISESTFVTPHLLTTMAEHRDARGNGAIRIELERNVIASTQVVTVREDLAGQWAPSIRDQSSWMSRDCAFSVAKGMLRLSNSKKSEVDKVGDLRALLTFMNDGQDERSVIRSAAYPALEADHFKDALPAQFRLDPKSDPLLRSFRRKSIQVGCDVSKLPVAPPLLK